SEHLGRTALPERRSHAAPVYAAGSSLATRLAAPEPVRGTRALARGCGPVWRAELRRVAAHPGDGDPHRARGWPARDRRARHGTGTSHQGVRTSELRARNP